MLLRLALAVLTFSAVVLPQPALATFHFMQIEQVIGGVNGDTSRQAVQLRMRTAGQNLVQFARIRAWDATGSNPVLLVDMNSAVPAGTAGRRILIATSNFLPGLTPDFTLDPIPVSYLAAGKLTFEDDFGTVWWSLAWGGAAFTGTNTGVQGTNDADGNFNPPFGQALPSTGAQALQFTGSAASLSSSSALDYALTAGAAVFINNAGQSGTVPAGGGQLPASLVAAVLPSSRSVQVGAPATAFATVINTNSALATACSIAPPAGVPASFTFQTTDAATNQLTGTPNTAVDIGPNGSQSFVVALTPTVPMGPADMAFRFACSNTLPAPSTVGLNTLLVSASAAPVPDIVALVATSGSDGIVDIGAGGGAFAVAAVNVGASGLVTVAADTGGAPLPVEVTLCQTDPAGACMAGPAPTVPVQMASNQTASFGVFARATGNFAFDPALNRIFVRFVDAGAITRGSTSVAARRQ